MRKIVVHIEELVLHGFDPASRHTIGDTVRAEIERRLDREALPKAWRRGAAIDRIRAGEVQVPAPPHTAGTAIGAAVHSGLTSAGGGEKR